jgi:hypothetical protein
MIDKIRPSVDHLEERGIFGKSGFGTVLARVLNLHSGRRKTHNRTSCVKNSDLFTSAANESNQNKTFPG